MLKIFDKFSPRANPIDGNYPNGSIRNESVPGANDGTPLDSDWGNDSLGFDEALLAEGDIVASGNPDTVLLSDRLNALKVVISKSHDRLNPDTLAAWKSDTSSQIGDVVTTKERTLGSGGGATGDIIAGTGTADGYSIISHDTLNLSWVLRVGQDIVYADQFGVINDFDPTTGTGTENLPFIQAAIDYAQDNRVNKVVMPGGNVGLGNLLHPVITSNLVVQLLIGSITYQNLPMVFGIHFEGNGTSLYAGREGRMLTIGRAANIKVSGFTFFHTTRGTITGVRGIYDNAIRVNDSSYDVEIFNNYLTNHLGWGIDITGDSNDPSSNLYLVNNVNIHHNIIKTRYGNGTRAYNTLSEPSATQGTGGAWCVAIINGDNITIKDNILIGDIDIENNAVVQTFNNISVNYNSFQSGWVTPQTVIGTDFWHDEPRNPVGTPNTQELNQGCLFNGVGLDTDPNGVEFCSNTIENGNVLTFANYRMKICNNKFTVGRIVLGFETDVEQITADTICTYNQSDSTLSDGKGFISIAGKLTNAKVTDNSLVATGETITLDQTYGFGFNYDCKFNNNDIKETNTITSTTSRVVTVNPFLSPTMTLNVSVFLDGGVGSAVYSIIAGGQPSTLNTLTVDTMASENSGGGLISMGTISKTTDGSYSFSLSTTFGTGRISVASPDSYANVAIT